MLLQKVDLLRRNQAGFDDLVSDEVKIFILGRVGRLLLRANMNDFYRELSEYGVIVSAVLLGALLLSSLLAFRFQREISTPVQHLADAARGISVDGDYSIRVRMESEGGSGAGEGRRRRLGWYVSDHAGWWVSPTLRLALIYVECLNRQISRPQPNE